MQHFELAPNPRLQYCVRRLRTTEYKDFSAHNIFDGFYRLLIQAIYLQKKRYVIG